MDLKLQVLSLAPLAMSRNISRGLQGRASSLNLIALRSCTIYVAPSPMGSHGAVFKGRGVPFEAPPLSHTPFLALLLAASQQAVVAASPRAPDAVRTSPADGNAAVAVVTVPRAQNAVVTSPAAREQLEVTPAASD